jgi:polysaccharide pyruvyl transferase WcaK-like protein
MSKLPAAILKAIKPVARWVWARDTYRYLLFAADAWIIQRYSHNNRWPHHQVVIAPDGEGNIGDQAMLDAYLSSASGFQTVLRRSDDALTVEYFQAEVANIPNLVAKHPLKRLKAVRTFASHLQNATEVVLFGADTIDGANIHASLARLSLLASASKIGIPIRILGFSWSDQAPDTLTTTLKGLSEHSRLVVRDPVSYRRLTRKGVDDVILGADIVFTASEKKKLPDEIQRWLSNNTKPICVINRSGMIHKTIDQKDNLTRCVRLLHDRGFRVIILPHVIRENDNDLPVCVELHTRACSQEDLLITKLLSPAQVRALVSHAGLVITGRMHLAILSLSSGVPAITFSTAGKVEGLYEMFDLPELVVEPVHALDEKLRATVDFALSNNTELRCALAEKLPAVIQKAGENLVCAK